MFAPVTAKVIPIRSRPADVVTIWSEGDDGFIHRRNGRFYHRRNPRHIEHCINMIRQRNAVGEEVRVDG